MSLFSNFGSILKLLDSFTELRLNVKKDESIAISAESGGTKIGDFTLQELKPTAAGVEAVFTGKSLFSAKELKVTTVFTKEALTELIKESEKTVE